MTSEIRVNKINNRAGLGTITIADTGVIVNGIVTCTEISGLNALNISGVSTFASPLDINGDIDVDGHTNLDNLSVAGVSTFSNKIVVGSGVTIEANQVATGQATFTGIVTASAFKLSDGSNVGGVDSDTNDNTTGGTDAGSNLDISSPSAAQGNTLFGHDVGKAITTGEQNTAVGNQAMLSSQTADYNSAFGRQTLQNNVSGHSNTAVGNYALNETTSSHNTAVGAGAMYRCTGQDNSALGRSAGKNQQITGNNNTLIGHDSESSSTSVSNEITLGDSNISHLRVPGIGVSFGRSGATIAGVVTATSFSGSGANLTSLPAQATIANNADNRVITGGSGVNLNGEQRLTWDGSQLYIDCTSYQEPILINSNQSSVRATVRQTNDANANSGIAIQKRHSSLHPANYWYGDIQFQGWDGSGYHRAGLIECVAEGTPSNDNMPGNLRFSTNSGAASQTERFRITAGGQLRLMEGNSVKMSVYNDGAQNFITSNSGQEIKISCGNGNSNGIEFWDYTGTNKRCQIDGQGIKFGTDTADANGLNDYEEGTYVPTTNSGLTLQGSYDIFAYIKIGRMCTVRGLFYPNNNPSGSGGMTMSLPFASYNYSQIAGAGGSGIMYRSISGADAGVAVYIPDNTSSAQFYKNGSNGGPWAPVINSDWGSAMEMYIDFTYFTV